jgi:hypothetical protein
MDVDASTRMQYLKNNIDGYIPNDFQVTKVYDTDAGNHINAAISAFNSGQNLVNHADHGDWEWMGLGVFWHGWYIGNSNIDNFINNGQLSNIVSTACNINQLDNTECISEHFVVYNANQAGVSFTGNTRLGYYWVGNPYSLSGQLDRDWWRGLFAYNKYILGEIYIWSKHQFLHASNIERHCEWEFNLLGEPSMPLWTDTPKDFDVSHLSTLPTGTSYFTVHVEEVGGGNVQNAYVCLWKDDEVYLTGNTNVNGDITFNPSPSTTGTMFVTVTQQNFIPYEGSANVVQGSGPDPDQSFVTLTNENYDGLTTCPAGDGPSYQYVMVTVEDSDGQPLVGIPAEDFEFIVTDAGATWYGTLSCTFIAVDSATNIDGEIRFEVIGDTSIIGDIGIEATVQGVDINDYDILPCKSYDYEPNGDVNLVDFAQFAADYGSNEYRSDFDWDGDVDLVDFAMFAQHYLHTY